MTERKIGRIETFFVAAALAVRPGRERRRRGRLGRSQPRRLGRGGRRRVRGLPRPLHRRRSVRHRGHLAGRLSRRLLPRRAGADVGARRARAGAVGPEGPRARPAGVADARRQGARQGPLLRLDRRRPAARDRRGRRGPQEAGLHRGQDERDRRARLDRHARSCSTRWSSGSRRRRRRAWTSGSTSTAGSTGRWPSSWPRRSSRSGCCSSRSRCCPRTPKGWRRSRRMTSTPIALGERLFTPLGLQAVLRSGRGRHHPARPEPRRRDPRSAQDRGDGRGL